MFFFDDFDVSNDPQVYAKVLLSVPKCNKDMMSLLEKIPMLD